jgi:small-conductance mechanosensitive channel
MGKVLYHVWDALAERGIEIPFPQRDIHVRSVFEQQTLPPLPKG